MEKIFCANDITTSEPTSRLAANKTRGTRLRISFIQLSALQCHSFSQAQPFTGLQGQTKRDTVLRVGSTVSFHLFLRNVELWYSQNDMSNSRWGYCWRPVSMISKLFFSCLKGYDNIIWDSGIFLFERSPFCFTILRHMDNQLRPRGLGWLWCSLKSRLNVEVGMFNLKMALDSLIFSWSFYRWDSFQILPRFHPFIGIYHDLSTSMLGEFPRDIIAGSLGFWIA